MNIDEAKKMSCFELALLDELVKIRRALEALKADLDD